MASWGIAGVLESTSLTSLNTINGSSTSWDFPSLKKRKLSHSDNAEITTSITTAQPIFSVKGHTSSLSDNEFKLAPIELLPRSTLPFSWLDTSTAMQSSNIFASNDEVLERMFVTSNDDEESRNQPKVLATRLLSNNAIYVVERVKEGIFAMTKLQPNIEESEIRVAAKAVARRFRMWSSSMDHSIANRFTDFQDWREAARLPDDTPHFDSFSTQDKFDVSVVFKDHRQQNLNGDNDHEVDVDSQISIGDSFMALNDFTNASGMQEYTNTPPQDSIQAPLLDSGCDVQDTISPTPDITIENLRTQYLEALYISKTSVAYFAKGPLARCRNAFAQFASDDRAPTLSSQYRESILSVKKMDAKYRETLPLILRNMTLSLSDDERSKKRKSKKKKKLGKNGLYSGEDEFLQKYWKSRNISRNREGEQESKDEEIKRHITELRFRETQLQILLILETIHLESSNIAPLIESNNGPDADEPFNMKRSKSKKEENLKLLLELLIDRLCIWHAVSAGESTIPESVKETTNSHLSGKKIESDALRDFCNEVIMPFYASRLPDQCKTIKKKLGGANEVSPARPAAVSRLKTSSSNSTSSSTSKPQSSVSDNKRKQLNQKPRRTLQRVLTDEQAADSQRARRPSLMRSSTTPALQQVKRESVEPSLPSLSSTVRGGIQIARRADKREVDLNAVAKQHETKLKKMSLLMEQKRELDAAINALRKPNRELVAKEVADHAEKRTSRKPKNPVRNPLGQGVQVMATPRGIRKKDMTNAGHHHHLHPPHSQDFSARLSVMKTERDDKDKPSPEIGSDNISLVPGSTIRTNNIPSSVTSKRKFSSINETPSRITSKRSDPSGVVNVGTPDHEHDHDQNTLISTPMSSVPCNRALFKVPTLPTITHRSVDEQYLPQVENWSDNKDIPKAKSGSKLLSDTTTFSVDQTPPAKSKSQPLYAQQFSPTRSIAAATTAAIPSSPVPVLETPIKGKGAINAPKPDQTIESTPVKSIYEQLGWNDDYDDDLAF